MLDVGWKLMLWMLFLVDDFFCSVYYYIFGIHQECGGNILQLFSSFIQRNEILKMQDVTDKQEFLHKWRGKLGKCPGNILSFYLCMFEIIVYMRMYDTVLCIYIYIIRI